MNVSALFSFAVVLLEQITGRMKQFHAKIWSNSALETFVFLNFSDNALLLMQMHPFSSTPGLYLTNYELLIVILTGYFQDNSWELFTFALIKRMVLLKNKGRSGRKPIVFIIYEKGKVMFANVTESIANCSTLSFLRYIYK